MAVSNDLLTDRRVARHCAALQEAGYAVTAVGFASDECAVRSVELDCATNNSSLLTPHSSLLGLRWHKGWRFYAELNLKLARRLPKMNPDVVWANDTDTLLGCWMAVRRLRCRGRRVKLVMDAHELFPEVPEIQHKPLVKLVWRTIERWLMPKCDAMLTVCRSIADYYKAKYGVEMEVVRNLSSSEFGVKNSELADATNNSSLLTPHSSPKPLSTLLYQGAVNLGRGVDWAIDALEWLPQCRLVVAGGGDLLEQMKAYAAAKPWAERVTFLGRLAPQELAKVTAQADVGLVMLEDMGLSYHFALPNRIGDFVAAGVPMVVSDLPEMAAVVRRFGVGEVIESSESGVRSSELAKAVERVLARTWSEEDFAEARKDMDWKKEKSKLLECLNVSMLEYSGTQTIKQ